MQGDTEDDEEHRLDSWRGENRNFLGVNSVEPKQRLQASSNSTTETAFVAPLRPSSISRVSGDHSGANAVDEEKRTVEKANAPVGESDVTVSIKEYKSKDGGNVEPQLVSYKKITSPSLG